MARQLEDVFYCIYKTDTADIPIVSLDKTVMKKLRSNFPDSRVRIVTRQARLPESDNGTAVLETPRLHCGKKVKLAGVHDNIEDLLDSFDELNAT